MSDLTDDLVDEVQTQRFAKTRDSSLQDLHAQMVSDWNAQQDGMTDQQAFDKVAQESKATLAEVFAHESPTEEEIAERGQESPLTAAANITMKGARASVPIMEGMAKFGSLVAGGIADVPTVMGNAVDDVVETFVGLGVPEEYFDGTTPEGKAASYIPGMRNVQSLNMATDLYNTLKGEADPEDYNHPVRAITRWLAAFAVTKGFSRGMGVTEAFKQMGRMGAVADLSRYPLALEANLVSAATTVWATAADEGLLDSVQAMGIPVPEFLDFMQSDEDDHPMVGRLKRGLEDLAFGGVLDVAFLGAIDAIRLSRLGIKSILDLPDDVVPKLMKEKLDSQLKAAVDEQLRVRDEIQEILGDAMDSGPAIVKRSSPQGKLQALGSGMVDDMAGGIVGAADDVGRPALKKSAYKINYAKLDGGEDLQRVMQDFMEMFEVERLAAQGPTQTLDSVQAGAKDVDVVDLLLRQRATDPTAPPLRPEETHALREFYNTVMADLIEVARAHRAAPSRGKRVALTRIIDIARETQRQIAAASAQASRTLGSFRAMAGTRDATKMMREVQQLVDQAGEQGVDSLAKAVVKLADRGADDAVTALFSNLPGLNKVLAREAPARAASVIRSYYYFALLSRVSTFGRQVIGNASHMGIRVAETGVAAMFNLVMGDARGVQIAEPFMMMRGILDGFTEAFQMRELFDLAQEVPASPQALKKSKDIFSSGVYGAWKTGQTTRGAAKIESGVVRGVGVQANLHRAAAPLDAVLSMPTRALAAQDEVFKTMFARMEGNALAYRKALAEVKAGELAPELFSSQVRRYASDPTEAMLLQMDRAAAEGTFTQEAKGEVAKWMMATRKIPVVGKLLMPFQRTPYNVAWESMRRTPMGILMPDFWKQMTSGDPAIVQKAWSRYLLGNLTLASAVNMFIDGDSIAVTGDARDPRQRQSYSRMGLDDMHVHIALDKTKGLAGGFISIPFRGMEPIAFPLAVAGTLVDLMHHGRVIDEETEQGDILAMFAGAVAASMTSANMISSMIDFFEAAGNAADPDRGLAAWASKAVTSPLIPGGVSQFVPLTDEFYREAFSTLDRVIANTPGMSSRLAKSLDAFGRERKKRGGWIGVLGTVAPKIVEEDDIEPVDIWLRKNNTNFDRPDKGAVVIRPGVKMKWENYPHVYSEYLRLAGQALSGIERDLPREVRDRRTRRVVNTPDWYRPSGMGFLADMNALVQGNHPDRRTQMKWDRMLDGEDGERVREMRQVYNYYKKQAIEVLLKDPAYANDPEFRRFQEEGRAASNEGVLELEAKSSKRPTRAKLLRQGF